MARPDEARHRYRRKVLVATPISSGLGSAIPAPAVITEQREILRALGAALHSYTKERANAEVHLREEQDAAKKELESEQAKAERDMGMVDEAREAADGFLMGAGKIGIVEGTPVPTYDPAHRLGGT